jgi:hypothetical protein
MSAIRVKGMKVTFLYIVFSKEHYIDSQHYPLDRYFISIILSFLSIFVISVYLPLHPTNKVQDTSKGSIILKQAEYNRIE